jgi:large subunit ribosomal protein L10
MSKKIKQMEMDALKSTFQGIRDLVMMSITGLGGTPNNQLRLALRKKNIRLQVVKNSLAKRVFDDMGIALAGIWEGTTTLAWGGTSVADLCKELDALLKKTEKVAPARRLASQIVGPASQVAGQIKSLADKPETAAAPAA